MSVPDFFFVSEATDSPPLIFTNDSHMQFHVARQRITPCAVLYTKVETSMEAVRLNCELAGKLCTITKVVIIIDILLLHALLTMVGT